MLKSTLTRLSIFNTLRHRPLAAALVAIAGIGAFGCASLAQSSSYLPKQRTLSVKQRHQASSSTPSQIPTSANLSDVPTRPDIPVGPGPNSAEDFISARAAAATAEHTFGVSAADVERVVGPLTLYPGAQGGPGSGILDVSRPAWFVLVDARLIGYSGAAWSKEVAAVDARSGNFILGYPTDPEPGSEPSHPNGLGSEAVQGPDWAVACTAKCLASRAKSGAR